MKALQEGIEGEVPKWEKLLADDVELATHVGGRARSVKANTYSLPEIVEAAVKADGDIAQALKDANKDLAVGTEMDVVAHEPGKVRLRAPWGDEWWVHRWQFYCCLTER